jgi:hypothetical protein
MDGDGLSESGQTHEMPKKRKNKKDLESLKTMSGMTLRQYVV